MDSIFLTLALNPWTNRWSKQVQQWNLVSKKSRDFDECWEGENGESYPKGEEKILIEGAKTCLIHEKKIGNNMVNNQFSYIKKIF